MIDLHCHILPQVDDGPQRLSDSLTMARMAVADGITDLVATPHTHNGLYQISPNQIRESVETLQNAINEANIPLRIHPGAEIHLHPDLFGHWLHDELQAIDHNRRYILLEFPVMTIPIYTDQILTKLIGLGVTPIIAHPERNVRFLQDPEILSRYISQGAICQLTADSLLGRKGKRIQQFSQKLIQDQFIHLIASDAHNTSSRIPFLQAAYHLIDSLTDESVTLRLKQNAESILRGAPREEIRAARAVKQRKYWIIELFGQKKGRAR